MSSHKILVNVRYNVRYITPGNLREIQGIVTQNESGDIPR